jgi:hypothetical protein
MTKESPNNIGGENNTPPEKKFKPLSGDKFDPEVKEVGKELPMNFMLRKKPGAPEAKPEKEKVVETKAVDKNKETPKEKKQTNKTTKKPKFSVIPDENADVLEFRIQKQKAKGKVFEKNTISQEKIDINADFNSDEAIAYGKKVEEAENLRNKKIQDTVDRIGFKEYNENLARKKAPSKVEEAKPEHTSGVVIDKTPLSKEKFDMGKEISAVKKELNKKKKQEDKKVKRDKQIGEKIEKIKMSELLKNADKREEQFVLDPESRKELYRDVEKEKIEAKRKEEENLKSKIFETLGEYSKQQKIEAEKLKPVFDTTDVPQEKQNPKKKLGRAKRLVNFLFPGMFKE